MQNPGRAPAAFLVTTVLLIGCGGGTAPTAPKSPVVRTPSPTMVTRTTSGATVTPSAPASVTATIGHIEVGGLTRTYVVVAPSDAAEREPLPLFVIMSRPSVTPSEARQISGADTLVKDPGAVLVYPEADGSRWNSGTCCFMPNAAPDDIPFMWGLIGRLEADFPINPNRVFIGGDGTGGSMAYRAACEMADRFAAVAVVGVDAQLLVDCSPARPIPVLHIYGSDDTVTSPTEGGNDCGGPCPTVLQTMDRWRQADGCTGEPTTTTEGIVVTTTSSTCSGGVEVEFIKANGLVDTWLGPGIDDLAVIWGFLVNHPRMTASR